MKYAIIFRFTDNGIAARSADFPELSASGHTVIKLRDIIRGHLEELRTREGLLVKLLST